MAQCPQIKFLDKSQQLPTLPEKNSFYLDNFLCHDAALVRLYIKFLMLCILFFQLMVDAMLRYSRDFGVQIAATACLYNLTKGEQALDLNLDLLKDVADVSLNAMERFPNYLQVILL